MNSIFTEIEKLTLEQSIEFDALNPDRYTLVAKGADRTKTAYSFGVPIYNRQTNNIVDMKYLHRNTGSYYMGSNARIIIRDSVKMQNQYGCCDIILPGKVSKKTENTVSWSSQDTQIDVMPTLTGVAIKAMCTSIGQFSITIKADRVFESTRSNDKYFSIMREKFVPFITVSCIGILNDRGEVIAPCKIHNRKVNEKEYILNFTSQSKSGKNIFFEINMQETKLFQDTTVESRHPKMNNAFGGTAFLGQTNTFGEQWLYSRLEFSNLPQLQNKRIIKAILHIPQLNHSNCLLTIHRVSARFCSFGSNWENKISITDLLTESVASDGYYHIDITKLIRDNKKKSENYVIRAKDLYGKPVVISTGDSFFKPQILEVKFK